MSRLKQAGEALGLRRSIVGLLAMVVLVGMGEKMTERFLPCILSRSAAACFGQALSTPSIIYWAPYTHSQEDGWRSGWA